MRSTESVSRDTYGEAIGMYCVITRVTVLRAYENRVLLVTRVFTVTFVRRNDHFYCPFRGDCIVGKMIVVFDNTAL